MKVKDPTTNIHLSLEVTVSGIPYHISSDLVHATMYMIMKEISKTDGNELVLSK